jgi:hypothetical protein
MGNLMMDAMTTNPTKTARPRPQTAEEIMRRYPRLVAHLICGSLGYFSARAAAQALVAARDGRAFHCEWYADWAQKARKNGADFAGLTFEEAVVRAGVLALRKAIQGRHHHRGPMAEYRQARAIVLHANAGREPPHMGLASWF